MDQHVSWIIELAVKDGALDRYKELMEEMVSGTGTEPESLAYEWYISADGGTVHIFEKYATSEAMVAPRQRVPGKVGRALHGVRRRVPVRRLRRPEPGSARHARGLRPGVPRTVGGFSRFTES